MSSVIKTEAEQSFMLFKIHAALQILGLIYNGVEGFGGHGIWSGGRSQYYCEFESADKRIKLFVNLKMFLLIES